MQVSGSGVGRDDRDVFRLAPSMDESMMTIIAERLENRGTDPGYTRLSQQYFAHESVLSAQRVLALGCGTGVEVRALKRVARPGVHIVGVDHSPVLVDVARRLTAAEGLDDDVSYQTADAHHLHFDDGGFDLVTMHTLISHVDDPLQVLHEARRVLEPGGSVAIFDGDYASLTFGYPDPTVAKTIEETLRKVMVANPRVMRDMPLLLQRAGLDLVAANGALYADIGDSTFWEKSAQAYSLVMNRSGQLAPEVIEQWRAYQAQAVLDHTFFGASNYYTYIARRPD